MSAVMPSLAAGDAGGSLAQEASQLAQIIALLSSMAGSIFATRYMSAVAVAVLLYDHTLTLTDEVELIWFNPAAKPVNRVSFLINRYVTQIMVVYVGYVLSGTSEGMDTEACQRFMWLFAVFSIVFVAVSHVVLMGQLYLFWDRRKSIKWILSGSFVLAMGVATIFFFLAAVEVQPFISYNPIIHMCAFSQKPWAMDFCLVTLTAFDLFIIVMTLANGFHRPYKTESEVMLRLFRDGAAMFVALFVLRVANLLMGLLGNPANTFVTMIFIWSMCSIVSSRIQLRMEGLNIGREDPNDFEELERERRESVRPRPDLEWDFVSVVPKTQGERVIEHQVWLRPLILQASILQPPLEKPISAAATLRKPAPTPKSVAMPGLEPKGEPSPSIEHARLPSPPKSLPARVKFSLRRAISNSASAWFD